MKIELKDIRTIKNLSDTLNKEIMANLPTIETYQFDVNNDKPTKIREIVDKIQNHPLGSSIIVYAEEDNVITCGDVEGCLDVIFDYLQADSLNQIGLL